jgi:hypothetical protein
VKAIPLVLMGFERRYSCIHRSISALRHTRPIESLAKGEENPDCLVSRSREEAETVTLHRAGLQSGHTGWFSWARGDLNPHILSDTGT